MAFNNVELFVINQASILLNDKPLSDLDSNSVFVVKAKNAFEFILETSIAENEWRFATTIAQLDLLIEPPEFADFRFRLRLPADLLAIFRIFNTGGSSRSLVNYEIFEDGVIFANVDKLSVEYRRSTNINKAPSYFVKYLVYAVSSYLALGFVKVEKSKEISGKELTQLARSLYIDRQNYPTRAILSSPFVHREFDFFENPIIGPFD